MISKEEVIKIAKLARLELTEKEIEKMQRDLSSILDYFEVLKKAPKALLIKKGNVDLTSLRKDEVLEMPASLANNLIGAAPSRKEEYIKVKSIL